MATSRFIFISYAREDGGPFAERLSTELAEAGHQPWRDVERLAGRGGDAWERELTEQLLSADLIVVVLTPGAVQSAMVYGECTKALENGLLVVPALFLDCDVPLAFVRPQQVDFRADPAAGFRNLLQQIDRLNDPAGERARNEETLARLLANRDRAARQGLTTPGLDARIAAVETRIAQFAVDVRAQSTRVSRGLEEEKQRAAADAAAAAGPGVRRYGRRPPIALGDTFHDRRDEQLAIRTALADPRTRMVSVLGRGGMGKTALACRILDAIEREERTAAAGPRLTGIAYLHHSPTQPITLDRTLLYIGKVLPDDLAEKAERVFGNRDLSTDDRVDRFLDLIPDGLVLTLFDNFEDLLDERGRIRDADLNLFVRRVLTTQTSIRLLVTARAAINLPAADLRSERQVTLHDGLPEPDAIALLRELDPNRDIGLAAASDAELHRLVERTYGIPRALELVPNILKGDDEGGGMLQGLGEVGDGFWRRESVVENLVEANYRRLGADARRVAEALAVYARPVPPVAVDFLLQPYVPGLRLEAVLQPLANARLVSVERGRDQAPPRLGLHRIDRDFLYERLPMEGAYSRPELHRRAAAFYSTQRIVGPRGWRSLTELQPQIFEYEHLVQAGEFDAAAVLLGEYAAAIAHCGHPTHCRDLYLKLPDRFATPHAQVAYWITAIAWKAYLGPVAEGLRAGEQALQLTLEMGDRNLEAQVRQELITAYRYASDGTRSGEHAERLGDLFDQSGGPGPDTLDETWFDRVLAYTYQGDIRRAAPLARDGYEAARRSGRPLYIATALNGLAVLYFAWGRYADAIRAGLEAESLWQPGFHDGLAYVHNIVGLSNFLLGDYPAAVARLKQAIAIADEWDSPRPEALAQWNLAVVDLLHGVYDAALEHGREAETLMMRLSLDHAAGTLRLAAEAALRKEYGAMGRGLLVAAQEWTRNGDLFPGLPIVERVANLATLHNLPDLLAEAEELGRQFRGRLQLPEAGA